MKEIEFENNIEKTLQQLKDTLIVKGKEYRRNNNPFHNFEEGARRKSLLREEILDGMRLKHEISISDMRNDLYVGKIPDRKTIDEKFNDILIYYLIEKAMFIDHFEHNKSSIS